MATRLSTRVLGIALSASIGLPLVAAPFQTVTVPADVAALVPEGAFMMGYTDSLEALQKDLVSTVSTIEPQYAMAAAMGGPAMTLNMLVSAPGQGPGSAGVKLDGAGAFFMGPLDKTTGEPIGGAIFQVADSSKVVPTQPTMHVVTLPDSNWVALSNAPYQPGTASSISQGMLGATIAINLDQETAVREFKPQIDALLMMMQMQMPPGMAPPEQAAAVARAQAANAEKIKMFLKMFKAWNIGVDLDGAKMDMLLRMHPTDLSQLVTPVPGLDALARYIPADMPITGVFDRSAMAMMMKMSGTDLAAIPEAARQRLEAVMVPWKACIDTVATGASFGFGFGDKGVETIGIMDTTNPPKTIADIKSFWTALQGADIGVSAKELPLLASEGVGYTVKVDMKRMMDAFGMASMFPPTAPGQPDQMAMMQEMVTSLIGKDGMQVRYIIEGDFIVNVIGNRRLGEAKSLVKSGGADNALSGLLADTLAPATWAARLDIRQLANEGLVMARSMMGPMGAMLPPSVPAGNPVPVSMVGSSDGTSWDQVRVRTDLSDWMTMIKQLQEEAMKAQMKAMQQGSSGAAP